MATMKTLKFPGSSNVYEMVDATARAGVASLQTGVASLQTTVGGLEDDTAAASAAASSALTNFAGAFSASTAYTAGQYVTYTDGQFYRFTTNHAAGAWNSAHVVAVTTAEEVSDLKSALESLDGSAVKSVNSATPDNNGNVDIDVSEYVPTAVDDWLDAHPEATTTVQDGSLTYKKLVTGTLGFVTPEMYGAKGDGVTDDTTALQSCIQSGNVVFLKGTYLITNTLNFNSIHDFVMYGGKITRPANQTFNTIRGKGCKNITIENVAFDGNGNDRNTVYTWVDNVQACIILASQSKDIYIEKCEIKNHNYGVFILGADIEHESISFDNTSMNGVIKDCVFHNCHSAVDTYGKSTLIDHNVFYGNTGSCVQLEGNNDAQDIDNPILDDQYFNSVTGAIISNNLFIDNSSYDINLFPNSYGISVHDNLHIYYVEALRAENYGGSKGINIYHNSYVCQKEQTIGANTRPQTYTPTVALLGKVYFDGNFIFSPYVGVYSRGNAIIKNNYIDKPKISGIVIYDNAGTSGISVLKGNVIDRHTPADGSWWGCYAIYIGNTVATLYVLDTIINTTAGRPIMAATGTTAIVKNLMSNVESSAITKPSGVYDYSN